MPSKSIDSEIPLLYHNDMSVCAAKVRNALHEKGIAWQGVRMDLRAGDAQKPEYVKLNPNQVVPTLVDRGRVIIESNVILEYIEDRWPGTVRLRPSSPADIAAMRLWMKQLDDGVHATIGTVSTSIAFRHQFLARPAPVLQAWYDNMVDEARRNRLRLAIEQGMESAQFSQAVKRLIRLLDDIERALADSLWLAGPNYSLADIAYSPYMIRMEHLGFGDLLAARPRVADWARRLYATPGYIAGVHGFMDPAYLTIFERERPAARQRINEIAAVPLAR
ncbi:Tetrachloro-P-hydroquinone reductive dehalogenase [compost metagenome]